MIIKDIATYIDTNIVGLEVGVNLFKGFMPDKPINCVTLYDTGGFEPDRNIPTGDPTFQVFVRNTDYENGHDIMQSIVDLLHRKMNSTIGDTYYYSIFLSGEPAHLGRTEKGVDEFSVNFVAHIRR